MINIFFTSVNCYGFGRKISKTKLSGILFLIFLFAFLFTPHAKANENFTVNLESNYVITETGTTKVKYIYDIQNNKTESYAQKVSLQLINLNPTNIVVTDQSGENLEFSLDPDNEGQRISIKLPDNFAGIYNKYKIIIEFDDYSLAWIRGGALEINVPKISYEYLNLFDTKIFVPKSFGKEAYVDPLPTNKTESEDYFVFEYSKKDHFNKRITAVFGVYQIYKYTLKYDIENKSLQSKMFSVPIPPDTAYQRSYLIKIEPNPINIKVDKDGNWLAEYKLKPFQKQSVITEGKVKVFPNPSFSSSQSPQNVLANLKSSSIWNSDNESIVNLAKDLQSVENIYKYVIDTLQYNHDRVGEKINRKNATQTLLDPKNAICTDYSDLFVTLSRSAGIPAREIQGYAYSDNSKILPLSLIADVLHSWPQYWSVEDNNWISVDPTWEDTSNHDYFNTFDMKHIAFVIHGIDDSSPLAPGNYSSSGDIRKDIYVTLEDSDFTGKSVIDITYKRKISLNPFKQTFLITFSNNGDSSSSAFYSVTSPDNIIKIQGQTGDLAPFSKYEIPVDIEYYFLAHNTPEYFTVSAYPYELTVNTQKKDVIILQLVVILIMIIPVITLTLLFTRKKH